MDAATRGSAWTVALCSSLMAEAAAAPALNERQRAYLLAIYSADQDEEEYERTAWSRGRRRRPADEWRWLKYARGEVPTALYRRLSDGHLVDQGTGSTFEALRARSLVLLRYQRGLLGEDIPLVRLTAAGRKLARHLLGQQAPKRFPAGTLREWHWRALARAYAAGDAGLEGAYGDYAGIGWSTWRRLRDYKAGALVEEHGLRPRYDHRLRITAAGRALYEHEWASYRALYPDVTEAPEPVSTSVSTMMSGWPE